MSTKSRERKIRSGRSWVRSREAQAGYTPRLSPENLETSADPWTSVRVSGARVRGSHGEVPRVPG